MTDPHTRHTRGLLVVIVLGVIFFALLALIILNSGKRPPKPPAQSETLSVLPLRLRLRTQPAATSPVVATATSGEKLIVLEDRGAWVRVQDEEGLAGWAERNALERTSERDRRLARYKAILKMPALSAIATSRTPLYAGPGIFYPIIGELPVETQVRVYTRDHDFYAIDHNGEIAYADVDAIDVSATGTRQLEVHTEAPAETTASSEPLAPGLSGVESPSGMPEPQTATEAPVPQPEPAQVDRSAVYAAVPAGGTQPEEIDRVVPRYPQMARRAGLEGSVVVRGIVRRDGSIDDVEIIKDLPFGLGRAAREAVAQWRFRPATVRGEPIDVYYTVTVNFRLQ